jgi:hypothetical protein
MKRLNIGRPLLRLLPYDEITRHNEEEEEKKKQSPLEKPKKQVKIKSNQIFFYK